MWELHKIVYLPLRKGQMGADEKAHQVMASAEQVWQVEFRSWNPHTGWRRESTAKISFDCVWPPCYMHALPSHPLTAVWLPCYTHALPPIIINLRCFSFKERNHAQHSGQQTAWFWSLQKFAVFMPCPNLLHTQQTPHSRCVCSDLETSSLLLPL